MNRQHGYKLLLVVPALWLLPAACNTASRQDARQQHAPATAPAADSPTMAAPAAVPPADSVADEKAFRALLAAFKNALRKKDSAAITALLHFPFQTTPQWSNSDLAGSQLNRTEGLLVENEFGHYYAQVFHADVLRLLPRTTDEQLTQIDSHTPEDYYQTYLKQTDRDAALYELYCQYPEPQNPGAETYFGFVFGRIKGVYKVLGYYGKWPVK